MGCLCRKSFSALLFMHQIPNPSRGRRLDDPMPPTAARQQSAIFYGVSLQQRYADCPFATIVYIICADSVSSGASSRRTLQKYLLKESFFIQIFLRYVQHPANKFSRGACVRNHFPSCRSCVKRRTRVGVGDSTTLCRRRRHGNNQRYFTQSRCSSVVPIAR